LSIHTSALSRAYKGTLAFYTLYTTSRDPSILSASAYHFTKEYFRMREGKKCLTNQNYSLKYFSDFTPHQAQPEGLIYLPHVFLTPKGH